ncbi:MAG TPA: winged helix DNA-binding domain-containing protein [Solirubrobacteraceae bacterium]|nr:winged helix DNA-binding domain-containing protein [Solirubrobacteraceae bacterium]
MPPTLTLRALNRATLARQMLLEREDADVAAALERLGGLQAQEAKPPFIGLWTRMCDFRREQLHEALHARRVVRATMMRATLHLVSAADYAALRTTLQPALQTAMGAVRGRDQGLDLDALLPVARQLLGEQPRTFNELRALLAQEFPQVNERVLGYATRMHLPLAMVPGDDRWSFPSDAPFTPAEEWLGVTLAAADPEALVRRHLGAFGPAAAADVQAWSGVGGIGGVLDGMRDELAVFKQGRRTLFDLPDAPRPDEDLPAPPRLLPEFDSLLLAHKDRTRVISDERRKSLTTRNLRVKATFLVDGFAAGSWSVARKRDTATLTIVPFEKLPRAVADELAAEGEALLRFVEDDAAKHRVEFTGA